MQHMQLENRQRLGFLASLEWTMRRIAEDMGWSSQAISDELRNRRVDSDMPFAERSRTPYDIFIEKHGAQGRAFLDALGIVRIPAKKEAKSRSRFPRIGRFPLLGHQTSDLLLESKFTSGRGEDLVRFSRKISLPQCTMK